MSVFFCALEQAYIRSVAAVGRLAALAVPSLA